jgi:formylglycine-generating enzyme
MTVPACHASPAARTGSCVLRDGVRAAAVVLMALAASASVVPARAAAPPAPFRDCPECPEMIRVPAGTFTMGTPAADAADPATRAESQATIVRIARPFAIGRMEVTRRQFAAFVADTDYEAKTNCRTWNDELARYAEDRTRSWQNPGRPVAARDDHPATCVSWADAKAYVQWLARRTRKPYRLPSESEWEYAARAGSTKARPWGESAADGCAYANVFDASSRQQYPFGWAAASCDDRHADVAPVGSLQPNAFGLHDMIGNVAEWVEDCATDSYVGRPRDDKPWVWIGGCERRIQRGGGWLTTPERARSAFRGDGPAEERADYLGFRVALDLEARAEGR